jgi:hypothetical protein
MISRRLVHGQKQGEHGVRPYNDGVGANPMYALASTSNGPQPKNSMLHLEVN